MTKKQIQSNAAYEIKMVSGGHDLFVVVPEGENASAHVHDNWIDWDRDDMDGYNRLAAKIKNEGGTLRYEP